MGEKSAVLLKFWQLVLLSALVGFLGLQVLHEAGHWVVLEGYGREPVMGFTGLVQQMEPPPHLEGWSLYTTPDGEQIWMRLSTLPESREEWVLTLAAGPLANVVGMLLGFALFRFGGGGIQTVGLLLAFINSFGPFLFQTRSMLGQVRGDEYLIARYLEIPAVAVHLIFLVIAVLGLTICLRLLLRLLPGWRSRLTWLGAVFLGFVAPGPLLMYADAITREQVVRENPLFRPFMGWSLPVVFTAGLAAVFLVVALQRMGDADKRQNL